jgi:hypothetical protein
LKAYFDYSKLVDNLKSFLIFILTYYLFLVDHYSYFLDPIDYFRLEVGIAGFFVAVVAEAKIAVFVAEISSARTLVAIAVPLL